MTDLNLKGRMDGWEVAKQSREVDPAFPIVYITGAAVGALAVARCDQQRSFRKAVRARRLSLRFLNFSIPTRRPRRQPAEAWRLLQNESGDGSDDESAAYDRFCIVGSPSFP